MLHTRVKSLVSCRVLFDNKFVNKLSDKIQMKQNLQKFTFEQILLNEQGIIIEQTIGEAYSFTEEIYNGVKLEMVKIPAGSFDMGSSAHESGYRDNESPQHTVNVQSFFMGKFPVTQAQWQAVMKRLPDIGDEFRGDNLPVVNAWWEDVQEFCKRLSELTNKSYRLPSEAEWEYSCRAGTTTPFHFGKTITTDVANYNGNYPYQNAPQGEFRKCLTPVDYFKAANAFGLYDMHGNVWEWCADVWHADYHCAPTDSTAWMKGGDKGYFVQRGDAWNSRAVACRSAFRVGDIAHNSDHIVGLRVCMSD